MKVGLYIDRMDYRGGAQRVVSNLCHGWVRRGWEVHLIVASGHGDSFEVPSSAKRHVLSEVHKRNGLMGVWDNFIQALRLGRVIRRAGLQAVVAVSVVANVQLALAPAGGVVTKVGSEHDAPGFIKLPWYKEILRRACYPRLDALVCPTQAAANHLNSAYPGAKARGIHNWLTWPLPAGDGLAPPAKTRDAARKSFISCGRLDKMKGFRELIGMFSEIKDLVPAWDLVIVGEGEDRPALEKLVRELGLGGRVSLPGWVADVGAVFRSANLFVFPSYSEGFALVLAEAMAYGLPCISYDCKVGPAEIIRHGIDGELVPDQDAAAFKAAMLRLAGNEPERRRLAAACPAVLERLSEDAIQPLWAEVLGDRRRSGGA
jgi:glycosyltransferase involved in cell wall biosynthesis